MFYCQEVGDRLNEEQIAPIIKEIKGALPEVEEDKIRKEIERYLQYGIEMQEAKRSIIRKFGGVETQFRSVGSITLKEIKGDGSNFDLVVKCLSASERMQRTQNGDKMLVSGLVADASMIRRFVSWDGHSLEKGKESKKDLKRFEEMFHDIDHADKQWDGDDVYLWKSGEGDEKHWVWKDHVNQRSTGTGKRTGANWLPALRPFSPWRRLIGMLMRSSAGTAPACSW